MATIMKLAATMAKTQNFMQLPLDEERKLASELEEIAISLEKVVEKLRGIRKVKLE
jgi:Flp pilus assembly CpaE family ATPase